MLLGEGGGASRRYVCVTEAKQSYLCFIVSGFRYNVHPLESSFTWFCSL